MLSQNQVERFGNGNITWSDQPAPASDGLRLTTRSHRKPRCRCVGQESILCFPTVQCYRQREAILIACHNFEEIVWPEYSVGRALLQGGWPIWVRLEHPSPAFAVWIGMYVRGLYRVYSVNFSIHLTVRAANFYTVTVAVLRAADHVVPLYLD